MTHGHNRSHAPTIKALNEKPFLIGIGLNIIFVIAEIIAGFAYNSMALLTDAGHNITDVTSLVLSLTAFNLANKKPSSKFTYGFKKTTILAALFNAIILLIAIGVLGYESFHRLFKPEPVEGNAIAWIAGLGIAVNSISAWLFFKNRKDDLNVKSAYLHLLADALVSIGVVVSVIVISYTHWYYIDPLIGIAVMVVILISTWSLLKDSFMMAVDAVPANIDINEVKELMLSVNGVENVHHVHIWALSTTENALTAHAVMSNTMPFVQKMEAVRELKHQLEHHNIQHSTIEIEASDGHDDAIEGLGLSNNQH